MLIGKVLIHVKCYLPREGESRWLIRRQRRWPAFLFSFVHLLFPLMDMWTTPLSSELSTYPQPL